MIAHFIEATNGNVNHGKFVLLRFGLEESGVRSALPGYEHESLWTIGGRRKFDPRYTMVVDLQTGEGAAFSLEGGSHGARLELERHRIWVCPMFEPFLAWLYDQGLEWGKGDITKLPRFVDIPAAPAALAGYRREGAG